MTAAPANDSMQNAPSVGSLVGGSLPPLPPTVQSDDSSVSGLSIITQTSALTGMSKPSKHELSFSFSRLLKTIIRCLNHNIDNDNNNHNSKKNKATCKDYSLSFDSCTFVCLFVCLLFV